MSKLSCIHAPLVRVAFSCLIVLCSMFSLDASSAKADTPAAAAVSCDNAAPEEIRRELATGFAGWLVQVPGNLSATSHDRWESEKPLACPGVAHGRFNDAHEFSYAVLIVSAGSTEGRAKLLVFSRSSRDRRYLPKVVEEFQSDGHNLFLHTVPVRRFFDAKSRQKFGALAPDAILLVNAGKDQYETDVVFWAGASFKREPVDY